MLPTIILFISPDVSMLLFDTALLDFLLSSEGLHEFKNIDYKN